MIDIPTNGNKEFGPLVFFLSPPLNLCNLVRFVPLADLFNLLSNSTVCSLPPAYENKRNKEEDRKGWYTKCKGKETLEVAQAGLLISFLLSL